MTHFPACCDLKNRPTFNQQVRFIRIISIYYFQPIRDQYCELHLVFRSGISVEHYRKITPPTALWMYSAFLMNISLAWTPGMVHNCTESRQRDRVLQKLQWNQICCRLPPLPKSVTWQDERLQCQTVNKLFVLPCDVCLRALLTWMWPGRVAFPWSRKTWILWGL